ncbi:MAG: DUF5698 domain-containing protein [Bacilli bacterium]
MDILFLCIKIFFARIIDVSLGTFRTMITVKGHAIYASIIGFFEVLVWFLIVKEALNSATTGIWIGISYAAGFAAGTYIGSIMSQKLIKGKLSVQVITSNHSEKLIEKIKAAGYGLSIMNIEDKNKEHDKYMLFIEIDNSRLISLQKLIRELDPKSFMVVNETKYVQNGYFSK